VSEGRKCALTFLSRALLITHDSNGESLPRKLILRPCLPGAPAHLRATSPRAEKGGRSLARVVHAKEESPSHTPPLPIGSGRVAGPLAPGAGAVFGAHAPSRGWRRRMRCPACEGAAKDASI
jgi:hypothetical protein